MEIRNARAADAQACVVILRDWIDSMPWMTMLHSAASMEGFWRDRLASVPAWVAVEEGEIVGFCVRDGTVVTALYLAADAQGRGVGRRLLNIAQDGQTSLTLWVFAANSAARAFYDREGFIPIGGSDGDNEEGLPDVQLRWERAAET
jgi:L-amino acid N-acyltransferase YncA